MKRRKDITAREMGRLGAAATNAKLTPEERKRNAIAAGYAAGLVHTAKSKMRKLLGEKK